MLALRNGWGPKTARKDDGQRDGHIGITMSGESSSEAATI